MKPGFFLIFLVFAFNGIVGITYGQSDPFEKWLESQDEQDDSELIEQLQTLREHPVNLNTATLRKFQTIPWLSPILARFILRNRLRRGKYRSWSDFKNRLNLEPMTLNRMKPYLTILKSPYQIDKKITIRSRIQNKFRKIKG